METQQPQAPPPPVQVLQMMMGLWVSQILAATARFGAADAIARGVTSSDDIAVEVDADPDTLYRLLRAAAACGLLVETAPRTFGLTPLGECLRTDAPGSMRDLIIAECAPGHWLPWGQLYDAVKSGRSLASEILGMNVWDYYAKNQEEALSFARGMGNLSAMVSQDVARLYDASAFKTIIDVGGSQGVLLRGLLEQNHRARGIIFDLPEVIDGAKHAFANDSRVDLVAGDFFSHVPGGGDLYVLKSILHDWPDHRCAKIVRSIHAASKPGAKLLVVEMLLPDHPQPTPVAFMDMNMLVMLNGRERAAAELSKLIGDNGFNVTRVIPTGGMFSLIEAERASD
jgi:hypothetical protein